MCYAGGVGTITENDITLAQASDTIVIGFNVIANVQARQLAEEHGVDVRTYRVIYQAVQDIEKAASGLLGPELREDTRSVRRRCGLPSGFRDWAWSRVAW